MSATVDRLARVIHNYRVIKEVEDDFARDGEEPVDDDLRQICSRVGASPCRMRT